MKTLPSSRRIAVRAARPVCDFRVAAEALSINISEVTVRRDQKNRELAHLSDRIRVDLGQEN